MIGRKSWDLLLELEGLVDKSAATLATSFENLLNMLLENILPAASGRSEGSKKPEIWLVHAIIGDAIGTNLAAAKILWAAAATGASKFVRYFLLVGKCGTHQSALSAKNGVIGRAAAAAAEAAGEGNEFEGVVSNAVRLFKYLVPDYYEDFKISIAMWVHSHVEVVKAGAPGVARAALSYADRMKMVYTKHVVPEELQQLWHHITPDGKFQTISKDQDEND